MSSAQATFVSERYRLLRGDGAGGTGSDTTGICSHKHCVKQVMCSFHGKERDQRGRSQSYCFVLLLSTHRVLWANTARKHLHNHLAKKTHAVHVPSYFLIRAHLGVGKEKKMLETWILRFGKTRSPHILAQVPSATCPVAHGGSQACQAQKRSDGLT